MTKTSRTGLPACPPRKGKNPVHTPSRHASRARKQAVANLLLFFSCALQAQSPELVVVIAKPLARTIDLPGEFQPYQITTLHARVAGYIEKVLVDRGSAVKQGQLLAELSAPETTAKIAEAVARVQSAESDRVQSEAQLAAAQSTLGRLKKAAETPGAIAGNEVTLAEKQVDAAKALVASRQQAVTAAQAAVKALETLQDYLKITAPFDGVVTDRLVHPGALVGPGADTPLLVIQQISRLRLTVAVPETDIGGIAAGAKVAFTVPAFPGRNYTGSLARVAHALDPKTRTMPVELEVSNRDGTLAPGMYPNVKWPIRRGRPSLLVPKTAVVTTAERTFVIRAREGKAEWVDVRKGAAEGDNLEVMGNLQPGDKLVKKANDEIRDGAPLK